MSARQHHSPSLYTFETPDAGLGGQVDVPNAVIRDVSMITGNLVARGHDLQVDDTTLKQIFECSQKLGQVPVKINHGSGIEAVNGYLTNFRRDGDKVRGDWHLLHTHDETPKMLERAQRQPRTIGLSVTFRGSPEQKGGTKHARCTELVSCDAVAHPAANPDGMFSVDKGNGGMPSESTNNDAAENGNDPLQLILGKLQEMDDKFESRLGQIEDFLDANFSQDTPGGDGEESSENEEMSAGNGDPVTQLEARISRHIQQEFAANQARETALVEEQAVLQSFEELKENHGKLLTTLSAKEAEIQALHALNKELRESGGMAPVSARQSDTVMFSARPDGELHTFEAIVNQKLTELKAASPDARPASLQARAFEFAVKNHTAAYEDYRRRQGQSK